jgi:DNA-binding HxlR family transcriptional regulator
MPKRYDQACPVAKSLEVVGDRWTLLVVRDLLRGTKRFQDLLDSLTGIAPNILSDRLKWMEERGLVSRRLYSDRPPRAEYTLTERGRELGTVVGALAQWGTRHVYKRARLVHTTCGHEVRLRYECPDCGGQVKGSEVTVTRSAQAAAALARSHAAAGATIMRAAKRAASPAPRRARA